MTNAVQRLRPAALGVRLLAAAGLCLAALAVPTQATAAPNTCGLPTSAKPGSTFVRSFSTCGTCLVQATNDNQGPGPYYYCTYNPSNGLSDEHYRWF